MNHLPNTSFLQSRPARVALARQRFFEEGHTPTGVVGEAVFESWARCLRQHGNPSERATFQPVTASRTQLALLKNRDLRQAWMDELPRLEAVSPLPSEDATPPVTKRCLVCRSRAPTELQATC